MRVSCIRAVFWILSSPSKVAFLLTLLLLLLGSPLITRVVSHKVIERELDVAGSEPEAAVAEPNLGTLLGLGNPLVAVGNPAALLQGIGGGHHSLSQTTGGVHGVPNLQALRDSGALGNICNNAGNSDALTNLLVYQYLSGSLPGGATNTLSPGVVPAAVGNPHLQALLEGSRESKTATSVTTTLTTRTITMEASTKFSTSTTSYITTVTSLTSSVLPIIFRGSKITTTITDRKTEVLTATEFHTSSSVLKPSIIQTLNVEITLTEISTKGLNGLFTLAQVTPGASKVLEQPISSQSVGFDLDLSSLDLGNLRQGDNNAQVVNALTALLKQYNDEPESERDSGRKRGRGRERNDNRSGNTRFHNRSRFSPNENDEVAPKYNVIRGFTLSDQQGSNDNGNSGSALENTRYSKFRKKNNVDNNSLGALESDRESERFSASTSRRTVSSGSRHESVASRGRSQTSRATGVRSNRQTERSRRRSGRTLDVNIQPKKDIQVDYLKENEVLKTTLLTMHISGIKPGHVITTVRTVTLRGLGTERIKRQIDLEPTAKSEPITATHPLKLKLDHTIITTQTRPQRDLGTERIKREIEMEQAVITEQSIISNVPNLGSTLQPEEVVKLLKNLNKSTVKRMLYSLHDWVDYYLHQVLDEVIEPSFKLQRLSDIETNEIPELYPSQIEEEISSSQGATAALDFIPNAITGDPDAQSSSTNLCPKVSVVTETVYQTLYMSNLQ